MGLPIATALFGLGVALLIVPLLSLVIDVPIFGPSLAVMIGLGVGIDYALFIITRFRSCLHEGTSSEDACAVATMELLGDRNWWFPSWLDRLVPRFAVEAPEHEVIDLTDEGPGGDGPDVIDRTEERERAVTAGR